MLSALTWVFFICFIYPEQCFLFKLASSKMKELPSFFKFFLPSNSSERLSIPLAFVAQVEGRIPDDMILRNHHGNLWPLKVTKNGSRFNFSDGWLNFVEDSSLESGDLLVFEYDGTHTFDVKIFSSTGCLKVIGPSNLTANEEEEEEKEEEEEEWSEENGDVVEEEELEATTLRNGNNGKAVIEVKDNVDVFEYGMVSGLKTPHFVTKLREKKRTHLAPNEPDVFDGNYQSPRDKDVSPKEGQLDETAEMPFNDGGEEGDKEVTPIQGHVEAQSPGEKQVKRYRRRAKGDASTEPTGRRGFRETRQSKSTTAPYLAAPPFKVQKMTHEQKKIVDFLIRQPKQDGPTGADETCIKIVGAKWPLTFNDVYRSFRPRGLVSKLVIHTVRDLIMMDELQQKEEGKLHPKRHIFYPDFAINLSKATDSKFNRYMRDACDVNKVHYDVRKCSTLILPILLGDGETGHWFCVAINLVDLRVEVLDSMQPADLTDRTSTVKRIWNNLFALLNHGQGVPRHTVDDFEIVYPKVPQQDNGHDCGVYLIKFMELWKGQMVSAELESDNMNNIRRRVLYALFMDERNQQRDSVLAAINN